MKRWLIFLLVIPAGLLIAGMLGLSFLVLSFFPPLVTWVAVGMMVVVGLWFLVGRRAASGAVGSEVALMGRQKSTEGML